MAVFTLITAPASEPISVAEARTHGRLDEVDDDAELAGYLLAARHAIERDTGRAFIAQTWTCFLERWPASGEDGRIRVPLMPAPASVSSVTVDGAAVSASLYALRSGELIVDATVAAPLAQTVASGVLITFTAGASPPPLLLALKMLAAHFYENREATSPEEATAIPFGVAALIMPYRVMRDL